MRAATDTGFCQMRRAASQVATARLCFRCLQGVNFAAAWEEYDRLRQLRGHADHYLWPMAIRAFETLLARGILTHADPRHAATCTMLSWGEANQARVRALRGPAGSKASHGCMLQTLPCT